MIEKLKPTDQVYLKRRYISNGNVYFQGHYRVSELPKAVLSEDYITTSGKPDFSPEYNLALKKQVITVTAPPPGTKQVSYEENKSQKSSEQVKPKEVEADKSSLKVNINSATAEELSKLKNVSTAIATKIIEVREKESFSDLENLKERVKLNRGTWDDLKSQLFF